MREEGAREKEVNHQLFLSTIYTDRAHEHERSANQGFKEGNAGMYRWHSDQAVRYLEMSDTSWMNDVFIRERKESDKAYGLTEEVK